MTFSSTLKIKRNSKIARILHHNNTFRSLRGYRGRGYEGTEFSKVVHKTLEIKRTKQKIFGFQHHFTFCIWNGNKIEGFVINDNLGVSHFVF